MSLSIAADKRVIDITYGELVIALSKDVLAFAFQNVKQAQPTTPGLHPETNLPEGPEEEVGNDRAREILRSKLEPISKTTLGKYRQLENRHPLTGENTGGYNLPYKKLGKRCVYKVKDLIALRNDINHFLKK